LTFRSAHQINYPILHKYCTPYYATDEALLIPNGEVRPRDVVALAGPGDLEGVGDFMAPKEPSAMVLSSGDGVV